MILVILNVAVESEMEIFVFQHRIAPFPCPETLNLRSETLPLSDLTLPRYLFGPIEIQDIILSWKDSLEKECKQCLHFQKS